MSETTSDAPWGSAIRLEHVSKVYAEGTRPAVDDVSLSIEPGEFVVLLGPSGCGKTTLLKMINRIHEPSSGTIHIDDVEIHDLAAPALRRRIGYVIQQTGLFPHMRIEDNVATVPKLLKWDRKRTHDRVYQLLRLVGLPPEDYARRYPSQLSGGEQQRVGLARALAAEPRSMLMDEPFGALDAITRTRLQRELKRLHHRLGQTVLFVTHDIDEAVQLADRIVVMREGRVVQFDTPLEIVSNPADAFVADLVGADDVLRRMSLITVASAAGDGGPAGAVDEIAGSAMLRDALGQMVETGADHLTVLDDDGQPAADLTMEDIRAAIGEDGARAAAAARDD